MFIKNTMNNIKFKNVFKTFTMKTLISLHIERTLPREKGERATHQFKKQLSQQTLWGALGRACGDRGEAGSSAAPVAAVIE